MQDYLQRNREVVAEIISKAFKKQKVATMSFEISKGYVEAMIHDAAEGDEIAKNEIRTAVLFKMAVETLFDRENDNGIRDALIVFGRLYGGATLRELAQYFKLDKMTILKILRQHNAD